MWWSFFCHRCGKVSQGRAHAEDVAITKLKELSAPLFRHGQYLTFLSQAIFHCRLHRVTHRWPWPMLYICWIPVADGGPTPIQNCVSISRPLGDHGSCHAQDYGSAPQAVRRHREDKIALCERKLAAVREIAPELIIVLSHSSATCNLKPTKKLLARYFLSRNKKRIPVDANLNGESKI